MFKDYNINQVILPLDLEMKLQENDIAYAVHELVEQIPDEAFIGDTRCPAYHRRLWKRRKLHRCPGELQAHASHHVQYLSKREKEKL